MMGLAETAVRLAIDFDAVGRSKKAKDQIHQMKTTKLKIFFQGGSLPWLQCARNF
jgi:hypothetical protein